MRACLRLQGFTAIPASASEAYASACHNGADMVQRNLLIASAMIRLDLSKELEYLKPDQQKAKDAVDFAALRREIQEMQEVCKQLSAPVVWSHNDLLSGNVMIPAEVCLTVHVHTCMYIMNTSTCDAW